MLILLYVHMYVCDHSFAESTEDIDRIRMFLEGIPKVRNFSELHICFFIVLYSFLNYFRMCLH